MKRVARATAERLCIEQGRVIEAQRVRIDALAAEQAKLRQAVGNYKEEMRIDAVELARLRQALATAEHDKQQAEARREATVQAQQQIAAERDVAMKERDDLMMESIESGLIDDNTALRAEVERLTKDLDDARKAGEILHWNTQRHLGALSHEQDALRKELAIARAERNALLATKRLREEALAQRLHHACELLLLDYDDEALAETVWASIFKRIGMLMEEGAAPAGPRGEVLPAPQGGAS